MGVVSRALRAWISDSRVWNGRVITFHSVIIILITMAFSWWQNMIFRLVTSMGQRKSSEHSWGIRFLCCDALTLSHRDYQSCQQRRVRQRHDNQLYLYPVFYILWQLAQSLQNNVVATVDIKKTVIFFSIQTSSKTFFTFSSEPAVCMQDACQLNFVVDLAHRLCGSVVEHQSVKSEVLRFESLWELRIFFPTRVTRREASFSWYRT